MLIRTYAVSKVTLHSQKEGNDSKIIKTAKKYWQLYLMLLLPLTLVFIFNYIPMYGTILAFKDYKISKGIWESPWVGLEHFRNFFSLPDCYRMIRNTLSISLYTLVASFPCAILLAICLNETRSRKLMKFGQMVTYAPYFISVVVLVAMLNQFLEPTTGIVNRIITAFGGKPQNLLVQGKSFIHLFVWSGIWQSTGYNAILYIASLTSVPTELYEAATIDGATKFQRILNIDIPAILPTATIMLIMNFGKVMNVGFEKAFLMQNAANMQYSEVISTYVYKIGLVNMNMSFSTAVNLFNSIVNLILIVIVNMVTRRLSDTSLF